MDPRAPMNYGPPPYGRGYYGYEGPSRGYRPASAYAAYTAPSPGRRSMPPAGTPRAQYMEYGQPAGVLDPGPGPLPLARGGAPYPKSPGPYQPRPGSMAPYPRSPGPYQVPFAGSMGPYPAYTRPRPGSSGPYHTMNVRARFPVHEAAEKQLPYADPDFLDATKSYLANPFSVSQDQGADEMYTTARSAKITPGEDFGTMVLTKSQRMMIPPHRAFSPYRSMRPAYPMPQAYLDPYGRPLTPRRRMLQRRPIYHQPQARPRFSDGMGNNIYYQENPRRDASPGWIRRRPDGYREPFSPLDYPGEDIPKRTAPSHDSTLPISGFRR